MMIDYRSGSGYRVLRDWNVVGSDGRPWEIIVVARTLLPVLPGPLAKQYVVRYGSPFAARYGDQRGILGEFHDFGKACEAAEALVRERRA
jgi:hypothetical protein